MISGESKLLTKQILLSKYWIEDGELEIVENRNLDKATKHAAEEVIEDNDNPQFSLAEENIDLTDNLDTTRMDFTGGMMAMEMDNAMPDEVFGGDAMMEGADEGMGGNSQQERGVEREKGEGEEVAKTLNNPGSVVDDVNQADKDN